MFAVIRIRGEVDKNGKVNDTLNMMNLKKTYSCIIVPETDEVKGMLQKTKDLITWGELDKETAVKMLEKRLHSHEGDKKVPADKLKELCGFDSFDALADALTQDKTRLNKQEKLKPVLRLTPPSKGFRTIMNSYPKGALGYRGKEINSLIRKMI